GGGARRPWAVPGRDGTGAGGRCAWRRLPSPRQRRVRARAHSFPRGNSAGLEVPTGRDPGPGSLGPGTARPARSRRHLSPPVWAELCSIHPPSSGGSLMKTAMNMALLGATLLAAGASPARAQVGKSNGLLYANLATQEQLATVPHLDAASVDAVLKGRPFQDALALDRVLAGKLPPEQRKEAYGKLFVPLNLNTATREEILLVPGVGPRMAHEFEEYRPYDSLARFRREIGKYVDAAEVARLEQYVFVPLDLNKASEAD